ncbi:MAG TPA: TIGR02996 domain-containing protein [Gemmataceae bacterium]|jgi:uncharacterized protein (TIGR02996 family)|nr:TIGR02996 domain-containing protein [Gemmataceae bacterium]
MPDDPAFIRAIAAAPDDDAPRLVYADVLDERGDEASVARAEFIRVQIERARLVPRTPRWNDLWHRDTALLDWARRWREELPVVQGVTYGGFIRGFIDRVTVTIGATLPPAFESVFDAVPVRRLAAEGWLAQEFVRRHLTAPGRRSRTPAPVEPAPAPLPPGAWAPARNRAELERTRATLRAVLAEHYPHVVLIGDDPSQPTSGSA